MSVIQLLCILYTLLSWNFYFSHSVFFCFFVTSQQKLSLFFVIIPSLTARHFSMLIRHSLCSFCLFTLHSPTCCIINANVMGCKMLLSHTHDIHNFHARFQINPLTPELNPSAQRCLMRFFTWDLRSPCTMSLDTTRPSTIFYRLLLNWASLRRH
jgi:hypothetical protein